MNYRYEHATLCHKGKKGMKWGFNDGKKNGKRTAGMEDPYDAERTVTKTVTTTYKNSDDLLDSKTTSSNITSGTEEIVLERGKISQTVDKLIDKGKSFINENYSGVDAYDLGTTTTKTVKTTYKNSDKLFDSTTTKKYITSNAEHVTKSRGKLSRAVKRGKAYIESLFD